MAEALSRQAVGDIARGGLQLPRGPYPGQAWRPQTSAERHLLRQAQILDGMRRQLLAETQRLKAENQRLNATTTELTVRNEALGREAVVLRSAAQAASAKHPKKRALATLTPVELETLAFAAAGESPASTGRILGTSVYTIKSRRARVLMKLGVETITHAAAIAVACGAVAAGDGGAP